MDAEQRLYYALGKFCYAVGMADGELQREEKSKVQEIVEEGLKTETDFDYSQIIFRLLENTVLSPQEVFDSALEDLRLGSHHLTDSRRAIFTETVQAVADAFPPSTPEEVRFVEDFKRELAKL